MDFQLLTKSPLKRVTFYGIVGGIKTLWQLQKMQKEE